MDNIKQVFHIYDLEMRFRQFCNITVVIYELNQPYSPAFQQSGGGVVNGELHGGQAAPADYGTMGADPTHGFVQPHPAIVSNMMRRPAIAGQVWR